MDSELLKVFNLLKRFDLFMSSSFSSRMMKSSLHAEEDDFVPELQRSIHPRERPDWEETLSAMVRLY